MFHVCSSKRGPLIYESSNASVLGVGSRGQLFVTPSLLKASLGQDHPIYLTLLQEMVTAFGPEQDVPCSPAEFVEFR